MKSIFKTRFLFLLPGIFLCGLVSFNLLSEESLLVPQIPKPESETQKRLYYQMKMRRYYRLYSEPSASQATPQATQKTSKSIFTKESKSAKKRSPLPYLAEHSLPKRPYSRPKKYKKNESKNKHTDRTDILKARPNPKSPYSRKHFAKIDGKSYLKKTRPIPGFQNLKMDPLPKGPYRYYSPKFYQGIYLNNRVPRNKRRYTKLLARAKKHKINTLVVDVQPRFPSKDFIRFARESGFYLVSRIVVYPGGLNRYPPNKAHIVAIANLAKKSAQKGFMEVQLDYIRFSDYYKGPALSWKQRYRTVATILKYVSSQLRPYGVALGADIFGRIPFNRHDRIGQNLEVFALYLDTIYPMLYPSHFYGDKQMQSKPYLPVYYGVKKSIDRIGKQSRIIAYIQAFRMHTKKSRLSYQDYIYRQLQAARDSGGSGFVAWNASSRYGVFFKALDKYNKQISIGSNTKRLAKNQTDAPLKP